MNLTCFFFQKTYDLRVPFKIIATRFDSLKTLWVKNEVSKPKCDNSHTKFVQQIQIGKIGKIGIVGWEGSAQK